MHTILVVDDEKGAQEAIKCLFRGRYHVVKAADAAAAMEILACLPIDLITLDLRLPDRPGMEVLKGLQESHPHTPVIVVTGYGSLGSADEAFRYGAIGYLLKPFNTSDLSSLIQHALRHRDVRVKSQLCLPLDWPPK